MIAATKQVGNNVRVYDERGLVLFSKCGTLIGYTSDTVSIKLNSTVWTYSATGRVLFGK